MAIDDDYVTETSDTTDTTHNYLRIAVPHGSSTFYYDGGQTATNMTSFLRLGAVQGKPSDEAGWDLASLVVAFNDDTRTRPGDEKSAAKVKDALATSSTLETSIKDSMSAFYGGDDVDLTTDQAARVKESMKLHTRGGWRDHSDGNRISTTRGDRVDLVRGNYKMVVLGRRPDEGRATGAAKTFGDVLTTPVDNVSNSVTTLDVSGGHVQDWNMSPGQITEISWVKTDTGGGSPDPGKDTPAAYYTWKTVEETVKGDVDTTHYGVVNELYLGPRVTTQMGWEGAPETDAPRGADHVDGEDVPKVFRDYPGLCRENPILTEQTWAKEIHSYKGSANRYVDSIEEKYHVKKMTSKTHVDDYEATVHCKSHIEDVYADYHRATFHGGDFREMWMGHFGELFLGTMETLKIGGAFIDVRLSGRVFEMNGALSTTVLNMAILTSELTWGYRKDNIFVGNWQYDISLATEHTDYHFGVHNEVTTGVSVWKAVGVFIL